MKLTSSVDDSRIAIAAGFSVYAKNGIGDWIKVDAVYPDGTARVADALSGFNDGTIGQIMTKDNANICLLLRDLEIA
jgi:hypothetical protein